MQKQTIQSRYVTLHEWAAMMFSKIPHQNTLLRWILPSWTQRSRVHDGRIQPQPEKVGKHWQVKRDARYVAD